MNYKNGFRLASPLEANGLQSKPAAAVNIVKGQALFDDGAGFATNTVTAFSVLFLGVAAANCDNSAGAAGDLNVSVIPPLPQYSFWVKNNSATVAAATDRNEIVDLDSNDDIDVTDNTVIGWGFIIDEIDISTAALAAAAGGFVKGRFLANPNAS